MLVDLEAPNAPRVRLLDDVLRGYEHIVDPAWWDFSNSGAVFIDDDLLIISANAYYPRDDRIDEDYILGVDSQTGASSFGFAVRTDGATLGLNGAGTELWMSSPYYLQRYSLSSGELLAKFRFPEYQGGRASFMDDMLIVHGSNSLQLIDVYSGEVRREWRGDSSICKTLLPDESGIAFAVECRDWAPVAILAIDLADMSELTRVALAPETTSVGVAVVPPHWTPPSTQTPSATPTTTTTPTRTTTPTPTPTNTPCRVGCVEVRVEMKREVRPGERVPIEFHIDTNGRETRSITTRFSADTRAIWDAFRHGSLRCRGGAPEDIEVRAEPHQCSVSEGTCRIGGFTVERPWRLPESWRLPLPRHMRIDCAVEIGRAVLPGNYPWMHHSNLSYVDVYTFTDEVRHDEGLIVRGMPVTFTPTPTITPTVTRTPTPTFGPGDPAATPCADCASIHIRDSRVVSGGTLVFEAHLRTAGKPIAGVQVDMNLPTTLLATGADAWRCRSNPFLKQRVVFHTHACGDGSCRTMRALVYGMDDSNVSLRDDTMLWTCRASTRPDARLGPYALGLSRAVASAADGSTIALAGRPASIAVVAAR